MYDGKRIILASKSQRRSDLLKCMGIKFIQLITDIDEIYPDQLKGDKIPLYLSKIKAQKSKKNLRDNDVLITADTIVQTKNNQVLGKPKDNIEARDMLLKLSNTSHLVITAITLSSLKNQITDSCTTEVFFDKISRENIDYYINTYKPFDKAGGYAIQEWIGLNFVKEIRGSYFNVVGLPTHLLHNMLQKL